jgi:hypothetical protein
MIAIPGNNCDIWLVVHKIFETTFRAYHITRQGIDPVPVISTIPTPFTSPSPFFRPFGTGNMTVSPDRTRLAVTSRGANSIFFQPEISGVLLCKFDVARGIVLDGIEIQYNIQGNDTTSLCNPYSVAFSPDNSKLYIPNTICVGENMNTNYSEILSQYNISEYDSSTINKSKVIIGKFSSSNNNGTWLRLYGDTIYIAPNLATAISSINNPNAAGASCDLQVENITLPTGSSIAMYLPNEVVYPFQDTTFQRLLDTFFCEGQKIWLNPALSTSLTYYWNDKSTNQTRTVTQPGIYWVTYKENSCRTRVDTFVLKALKLDPIINVNIRELSTTMPYSTYQWLLNSNIILGATHSTYTVTENGDYQVIVSNENGCVDTSSIYKVTDATDLKEMQRFEGKISVFPNPTSDLIYIDASIDVNISICSIEGGILKQAQKARQIGLRDLAKGIYFLRIYDMDGVLIKVEKITKEP